MRFRRGETVIRRRPVYTDPPEVDAYGSEIPSSWDDHPLSGVMLAPRTDAPTPEDLRTGRNMRAGRQPVVVGLTMYGAWDMDVDTRDQIVRGSEVFEVEGEVARWTSPTGLRLGATAMLRRVRG